MFMKIANWFENNRKLIGILLIVFGLSSLLSVIANATLTLPNIVNQPLGMSLEYIVYSVFSLLLSTISAVILLLLGYRLKKS